MAGRIKRALISVSDKEGIIDFARGLQELGVEIVSTGGTAKALKDAGVKVKEVSEYTGFREILGGRVKTVHPKIHGGILAKRGKKEHMEELEKEKIEPIDLVVCNLYPFEETVEKGADKEEVLENIDIGGPAMIRAAAKNYEDVGVVVDPGKYGKVLGEIKEKGDLSAETRKELAADAFRLTTGYDYAISNYFEGREDFPKSLDLRYEKVEDLRYGENPHLAAALYREAGASNSLSNAKQLQGKQMSFNNYLDADAAIGTVKEFDETAAVVIKHVNPCGVAVGGDLVEDYRNARECDQMSAFGSVVALNRKVDEDTAKEIASTFIEIVAAPSFDRKALEILGKKKNMRVLEMGKLEKKASPDLRRIEGGILVQDSKDPEDDLKVVTERKPSDDEMESMKFAWKVCKHVKSNAIVLAKGKKTVGIGAGQPSRVDAVRIAIEKSKDPKGSALASDAFFPFRDGIDEAAKGGITAIIQPGGSIRDEEIVKACDEHKIAMVLTGTRIFRH